MKFSKSILPIFLMLLVGCINASAAKTWHEALGESAPADSTKSAQIVYDQYDSLFLPREKRTTASRCLDTVSVRPTDYILEGRVRYRDDKYHGFWDNLYLNMGLGYEKIADNPSGYKINPLGQASIGLGYQFNKFSSLRLSGEFGVGFSDTIRLQTNRRYIGHIGGKLDWLYDVSSFIGGYKPNRFMSVNTLFGVGGRYTFKGSYTGESDNCFLPEFHTGLQFRFLMTPQTILNVEPYVGIAKDNIDLSEKIAPNWRTFNVFYGVNLSVDYYMTNHLTDEANLRYLNIYERHMPEKDKPYEEIHNDWLAAKDTLVYAWRKPFFMSFGMGAVAVQGTYIMGRYTVGHTERISLGKWFSPSIGARLSIGMSDIKSEYTNKKNKSIPGVTSSYNYRLQSHNMYPTAVATVLFNPFGFTKKYDWDNPVGMHFIFSGGYDVIKRWKTTVENNRSFLYEAGMQAWCRLSPDLQLYLEPRYSKIYFLREESKRKWDHENMVSVDLGMTMLIRSRKYGNHLKGVGSEKSYFTLGGGLGSNFQMKNWNIASAGRGSYKEYPKTGGFNWNLEFVGAYHFNKMHSIRTNIEFMEFYNSQNNWVAFYKGLRYIKGGRAVVNHTYLLGLASLDYQLNLTDLMSGYRQNRHWNLELFFGPSTYLELLHFKSISDCVTNPKGYDYKVANNKTQGHFGLNAGLQLSRSVSDKIDIYISPTWYNFFNSNLPYQIYLKQTGYCMFGTVNLGLQYKL